MVKLAKREYIKKYFEYYYNYCDDSKYLDFFKEFIFNTDYDFLECSLKFKEDGSVVGNRINLYYDFMLFDEIKKTIKDFLNELNILENKYFEKLFEFYKNSIYVRTILGYDLSERNPIYKLYILLVDEDKIKKILDDFDLSKKGFFENEMILGLRISKDYAKIRLYFYDEKYTYLKNDYSLLDENLIDKYMKTYEINLDNFFENRNRIIFNSNFIRINRNSFVFTSNEISKKLLLDYEESEFFWCKINQKYNLISLYY